MTKLGSLLRTLTKRKDIFRKFFGNFETFEEDASVMHNDVCVIAFVARWL